MSALIKSGDMAVIRPFSAREQAAEPAQPTVDPRQAECDALRKEVDRLTRALAEARTGAEAASARARDEGREAGRSEATKREGERVSALRDALDLAVDAFGKRLDLLDGLAPALARASLEKLFDAPEGWSQMSEAMLARQLRLLRRSSVIAIRVSPVDFADAAALDAVGAGDAKVLLDPDLRAGACRIECKLGQIDLDAREQWSELAALLCTMEAA